MKTRKTRKMKKMRGGIISKNNENNWHLDAATVNKVSTPTVNRYRDLEIIVLNKLAKKSASSNSNVVLEHETILERKYRDMCEIAKGDGNIADIKTLKDNIASIINLRYEEGIDRLRPRETDEERIKRENHETRLNLWKRKYTIIKKLFNEVQRTLHKPREREDGAYLSKKLKKIEENLDLIDVVFRETIKKATELHTNLSIYLVFEESLPNVFHSTTTFSTSLKAFIEQKQAEHISSKEILTLKRTATIELIARSEEEEREERVEEEREERVEDAAEVVNPETADAREFVSPVIEEAEPKKREETEEEAMKKALLLADSERAELKQRAEEEITSMDKRAEMTEERSTLSSIRQDSITLDQYEKSKQVLEASKLKILALTDTLDELSQILGSDIVDSIYQFYGEMKNGPENEGTMAVKRKLDALLDDLRHTLPEDLRGNIDVLIKTVEDIHKTKKFFDKQSAKIAEERGAREEAERMVRETGRETKVKVTKTPSKQSKKELKADEEERLLQKAILIADTERKTDKITEIKQQLDDILRKKKELNDRARVFLETLHKDTRAIIFNIAQLLRTKFSLEQQGADATEMQQLVSEEKRKLMEVAPTPSAEGPAIRPLTSNEVDALLVNIRDIFECNQEMDMLSRDRDILASEVQAMLQKISEIKGGRKTKRRRYIMV